MKSFFVERLFDEEDFKYLQSYVYHHINNSVDWNYAEYYGRYWNTIEFNEYLENLILAKATWHTGIDNLGISYTQCIRYKKEGGTVPRLDDHIDNFYATYTLDIVIDTTINWPLTVEGINFPAIPNSGVFLKGDEDHHSRPEYLGGEEDYITLLYINIAKNDSDIMRSVNAFKSLPEDIRKRMKNRMIPNNVNSNKDKYIY